MDLHDDAGQKNGLALTAVTAVFFMWGFITVLNDILVPHLKAIFELSYFESMLIQFTFFSAYFLMSIPASSVIARLGFRRAIIAGLCVVATGALVFLPAAGIASYPLFLLALWILASGITLLQVAANPYIAGLGRPEGASSRLNLAQAFNSLGTTVGPFIGGALILSNRMATEADQHARQVAEAASVRLPYIGIAVALFLIAALLSRMHLPEIVHQGHRHSGDSGGGPWSHRQLVLGIVAIFIYVGTEVSIGSFLVSYLSQADIGGFTSQAAARYVSFYWGGAMVGRFIGSGVLRRVPPGRLLGTVAILASGLVWMSFASHGPLAMWSILAVGLCNSVMFPTIFTLGISGLGPLTSKGSGLLIMAIVGGAVLPLLQGALADTIGIHQAFAVPAVCYLYIVFYGFHGSQVRRS